MSHQIGVFSDLRGRVHRLWLALGLQSHVLRLLLCGDAVSMLAHREKRSGVMQFPQRRASARADV